jgi:hypothetical protein
MLPISSFYSVEDITALSAPTLFDSTKEESAGWYRAVSRWTENLLVLAAPPTANRTFPINFSCVPALPNVRAGENLHRLESNVYSLPLPEV